MAAQKNQIKFKRNICKILGHEWSSDPNRFGDVCTRCKKFSSWIEAYDLTKKKYKKIFDEMYKNEPPPDSL